MIYLFVALSFSSECIPKDKVNKELRDMSHLIRELHDENVRMKKWVRQIKKKVQSESIDSL